MYECGFVFASVCAHTCLCVCVCDFSLCQGDMGLERLICV